VTRREGGRTAARPWPGLDSQTAKPRGRLRPDLIYLGWRQVLAEPDPGPPPSAPAVPEADEVSPDWMAAQRREHRRLARPARLTGAAALAATLATGSAWLAGLLTGVLALPLAVVSIGVAGCGGRRLWRSERALVAALRAEERRVAGFRNAQRREHAARLAEHAGRYREWQQRTAAFQRQPLWYPVTLPTTMHRLDVAGGTLAGWSALITMIAAPRLAAGGEVTIVDLTEGGVAADLLAVARRSGIDPLVWVLPADLPRLDLGASFGPDLLADVLARTVSAAGTAGSPAAAGDAAGSPADTAQDAALLSRVLRALGDIPAPGESQAPGDDQAPPTMAQLAAALRALGQIGGPADHLSSGALTPEQLANLGTLAGRGAEHLVVERAWALEARLRVLEPLATSPVSRPPSRLKVAWLDRRAAAVGNSVLAGFLAVALTALLRQAPAGQPWQQTLCLLGAERLAADVLDRLCDAAEIAGAGLVLAYRSVPAHVRERLGRGDAAVGFMRLGNAEDARLAAEQIGTEYRFVISQLTDTVGVSVTDTAGLSYTSSVGSSDSISESDSLSLTTGRSRGRGRSNHGTFAPFADFTGSASSDASSSAAISDSSSITAGISTGTSWGWSTSRALGASDSLARTAQRSRESLVEQHELQQLPPSAVLLCYPAPGGRQVVLADANPAIMTLPTATLASPPGLAR
jgi:hypothetical protein